MNDQFKKPTEAEAKANQDTARKLKPKITKMKGKTKEHSEAHWSATFANGRRVEIYPKTMAFHRIGGEYRRMSSDEMLIALQAVADLDPPAVTATEILDD